MVAMRAPGTRVRESARRLEAWLVEKALPFWAEKGTDHCWGGFFERLAKDDTVIEEPRRTRVVARQSYVFATSLRLGWNPSSAERLQWGLSFLLDRLLISSNTFARSLDMAASRPDERFELYENAFALLALASAAKAGVRRSEVEHVALGLLSVMKKDWAHPVAGFVSRDGSDELLESNPHMHLFEAALEWEEVAGNTALEVFRSLSDQIAALALGSMIDSRDGALSEFFDEGWKPVANDELCVVEPGHQFEWAWLLQRWGNARHRSNALTAARRLAELGERHGVDVNRNVVINSLNRDLTPRDANAKLWPQTERIKAWCAMAALSSGAEEQELAERRIVDAVEGLMQFTNDVPDGHWIESIDKDSTASQEPTRASSLYHIVCATETLATYVSTP